MNTAIQVIDRGITTNKLKLSVFTGLSLVMATTAFSASVNELSDQIAAAWAHADRAKEDALT